MKVSILGVEFYSENLGCGALAYSSCVLLDKIAKKLGEDLQITAFVIRPNPVPQIPNMNIQINCVKYQLKSMSFWKEASRIMKESDFIIDFSLGDSFSDLYGDARFYKHSMLRKCALRSGRPYILGPQTLGPFDHFFTKRLAKQLVRKSKLCFARDAMSQEYVKQAFGREALVTTDVAFALPYAKDENTKKDGKIHIGFNPSGLLWDGQNYLSSGRKLKLDYKEYVQTIIGELSKSETYVVHLIPHVFSPDETSGENDWRACKEIHAKFPNTVLAPLFATPMEAKGYISGMDVFIGARMHATIAALSSGVVTIPFSYSRKFEGLFQGVEYPYVISATEVSTEDAIETTRKWIQDEEAIKVNVIKAQENAKKIQEIFLSEIAKMIEEQQ